MENILQQILSELKNLREGQEAQGQRLERVEKNQEAQGQRLERVENRLQALEQGQEALQSELHQVQESLQSQITRLEVRLETEAFGKIGALFDGYQLTRETLERIEKKLEAHDARLDIYGDEIALLRSRKK